MGLLRGRRLLPPSSSGPSPYGRAISSLSLRSSYFIPLPLPTPCLAGLSYFNFWSFLSFIRRKTDLDRYSTSPLAGILGPASHGLHDDLGKIWTPRQNHWIRRRVDHPADSLLTFLSFCDAARFILILSDSTYNSPISVWLHNPTPCSLRRSIRPAFKAPSYAGAARTFTKSDSVGLRIPDPFLFKSGLLLKIGILGLTLAQNPIYSLSRSRCYTPIPVNPISPGSLSVSNLFFSVSTLHP